MLTELRVKNFALIKNLSVHFDKGLNVITGETGAGKSLVLKSLQILMGGKAPSEIVGQFSDETLVEGLFIVQDRSDIKKRLEGLSYALEDENTLLVRRIISSKGRSKTYLNGSLASLNDLKSIVSPLIDLSGSSEPLIELTSQHDNKNLTETSYQRDLFDTFCKNRELRAQISNLFSELKDNQNKLASLKEKEPDRLQKIDFLEFQLGEMNQFNPNATEYEELEVLKTRKEKEEKLKEIGYSAIDSLKDSDQSVLSQLYTLVNDFEKNLPSEPILEDLNAAIDLCESAFEKAKSFQNDLNFENEELTYSEINERIKTYKHLFRKYNTNAEGLSKIFEDLKGQKEDLEDVEEKTAFLENEIKKIKSKLIPIAKDLTQSRTKQKGKFESKVNSHLKELNMKGLMFKVKLEESELSEFGLETISFWLSYDKDGKQDRSIKKAASGGELSRILLALKSSLENQEAPRTYLFDEIDAGVSGPTADKVGKKLRRLSKGQQVITITHLPQVAALSEHHFLIEKTSGRTGQETKLKNLTGTEKTKEIARLISGEEITSSSLKHANELIAQA